MWPSPTCPSARRCAARAARHAAQAALRWAKALLQSAVAAGSAGLAAGHSHIGVPTIGASRRPTVPSHGACAPASSQGGPLDPLTCCCPGPPPPPSAGPRPRPPQFTKAVESKQVAQQEAERARFVVMKADQERKAAVIRAEVGVCLGRAGRIERRGGAGPFGVGRGLPVAWCGAAGSGECWCRAGAGRGAGRSSGLLCVPGGRAWRSLEAARRRSGTPRSQRST